MSTRKKLLFAGCGQLGSRHLQSMAHAASGYDIDLLDPFPAATARARALLDSTHSHTHRVNEFSSPSQLTGTAYDFVVVATNSDQRLLLIEALLAHQVSSEAWLLEKVLCQSSSQADRLLKLLEASKAWVNCPRRVYPGYIKLRELMSQVAGPFSATYEASQWGLACNSIHYLDLFEFLFQEKSEFVMTDKLLPKIVAAKRAGFEEFYGTLQARFSEGGVAHLTCHEDPLPNGSIHLSRGGIEAVVDETQGTLTVKRGSTIQTEHFPIPFQSQLTLEVIERFWATGETGLTPLKTSVEIHRPFLDSLQRFYNELTGLKADKLPIT